MFSALKNTLATWKSDGLALRIVLFLSALMLCGVSRINGQGAQAGWVLEMKGQWAVSGTAAILTQAASVPAGGQLVNLAPEDGDYIRIADLHGELLRSLQCSKDGCGQCVKDDQCTAPIEPLPQAPEQPKMLTAAWEGLMGLFVGQPERYSVHRSRSLTAENCIAEDIVPLDASGVAHLDHLLKNCEPGSYTLDFAPATPAATRNAPRDAKEVTVHWNPNEHSAETIELAPGLYQLNIDLEMGSGSSWVLVSAPSTFKNDRAAFEIFSAEIDGWGGQVERDSKVAYRRAYLDYLSRPQGGKDQGR